MSKGSTLDNITSSLPIGAAIYSSPLLAALADVDLWLKIFALIGAALLAANHWRALRLKGLEARKLELDIAKMEAKNADG